MVQRAHQEDALTLRNFEVRALQDDRAGDDEEQSTDEDEKQFGAAHDREAREGAAESERAGVTHKDLCRRRIPPEESNEASHNGGRNNREVEGVTHFVTEVRDVLVEVVREAPLVVLPEADEDVRRD